MYKLEVKLKQHTPLIHFQHDQEGATLRASEVKPKLDRFILIRLGKNATEEQKKIGLTESQRENEDFNKLDNYKKGYFIAKSLGWLIGKGNKPALDYKMKIEISNNCLIDSYVIGNALKRSRVSEYERKGHKVLSNTPYFSDNKLLGEGSLEGVKLGLMINSCNR